MRLRLGRAIAPEHYSIKITTVESPQLAVSVKLLELAIGCTQPLGCYVLFGRYSHNDICGYTSRLGRLAPPSGALTPISSCQNGKRVILKALRSKAFKITFQVVYTSYPLN